MNHYWFNEINISNKNISFHYKKRVVRIPLESFYSIRKIRIQGNSTKEYLFNYNHKIFTHFKNGQLVSIKIPYRVISLLKMKMKKYDVKYTRLKNKLFPEYNRYYKYYRRSIIIISILFLPIFLFLQPYAFYILIVFIVFLIVNFIIRRYYFNRIPINIDIVGDNIIINCKWERFFFKKDDIDFNKKKIDFKNDNKKIKFYHISNYVYKTLQKITSEK